MHSWEAGLWFCLRKETLWNIMRSPKKILPQAEIDKTEKTLKNIMVCLEDELTETEQKIIRNNIVHLPENKKEKQKTLKEHQNDIVKCAEMFF